MHVYMQDVGPGSYRDLFDVRGMQKSRHWPSEYFYVKSITLAMHVMILHDLNQVRHDIGIFELNID